MTPYFFGNKTFLRLKKLKDHNVLNKKFGYTNLGHVLSLLDFYLFLLIRPFLVLFPVSVFFCLFAMQTLYN